MECDYKTRTADCAHFFGIPCSNCGHPMMLLGDPRGLALSDFKARGVNIYMHCTSCRHIDTYATSEIKEYRLERSTQEAMH
jgi:hypothetical protein